MEKSPELLFLSLQYNNNEQNKRNMKNYSNNKLIWFANFIDTPILEEDNPLRLAIEKQFGDCTPTSRLGFAVNLSQELGKRLEMRQVADEINEFLEQYGLKAADDPEYYNSGDANWLMGVAKVLSKGITDFHWIGSSYMHGGYKKGGEEIHDKLLERISSFQRK